MNEVIPFFTEPVKLPAETGERRIAPYLHLKSATDEAALHVNK